MCFINLTGDTVKLVSIAHKIETIPPLQAGKVTLSKGVTLAIDEDGNVTFGKSTLKDKTPKKQFFVIIPDTKKIKGKGKAVLRKHLQILTLAGVKTYRGNPVEGVHKLQSKCLGITSVWGAFYNPERKNIWS